MKQKDEVDLCIEVLLVAKTQNTQMWQDFKDEYLSEYSNTHSHWDKNDIAEWISSWWLRDMRFKCPTCKYTWIPKRRRKTCPKCRASLKDMKPEIVYGEYEPVETKNGRPKKKKPH